MMLLLLVSCLMAQDTPAAVAGNGGLSYVRLDITAQRRKGKVVSDLTQDDFVVKDGKNKVEVVFFDLLDYRDIANCVPSPRGTDTAEPVPVVLALDLAGISPSMVSQTFEQLYDFFAKLDAGRHRFYLTDLGNGPLSEGFLPSPTAALAVLRAYETRLYKSMGLLGQDGLPLREQFAAADETYLLGVRGLRELVLEFEDCVKEHHNVPPLAFGCMNEGVGSFLSEERDRAEVGRIQLAQLVGGLDDSEQLKLVFLISPGFNIGGFQSLDELRRIYRRLVTSMRSNSRQGQDRYFRPGEAEALGASPELMASFQGVIHGCMQRRVLVHGFDIYKRNRRPKKGVQAMLSDRLFKTYMRESADALEILAQSTGGRFVTGQPLVGPMLDVINKDSLYYVLGYQVPADAGVGFRQIEVKCKRRGVKLHYRRGYFSGGQ